MSRFFINRPIVAIVIAILTTIVGIVAMIQLPISQYPSIVPPEIQVRANYTGADAQTIEQSVATPIEQQMSGVDRSNYIQSVNAERLDPHDGELRDRHRSERRPHPDADADEPGQLTAAGATS